MELERLIYIEPSWHGPSNELDDGDPVVSLYPGTWVNEGAGARITYRADPGRFRFAGDPDVAGALVSVPLSGGPGFLSLVITVVSVDTSGVIYQDGNRAVEVEGETLSVWAVEGGVPVRSIPIPPQPLGTPFVLSTIEVDGTTTAFVNGVPQGTMTQGVFDVGPLEASLRVIDGVWDMHHADSWLGVPSDYAEQIAWLVRTYVPAATLTAATLVTVTGSVVLTDDDPWADIPIPDPEEPGGALIPPEVPEPTEPPDPDW